MTRKLTPEVVALQEECTVLGIEFHHMHGEAKLQELIDAHNAGQEKPDPLKEKITPVPPERYMREKQIHARKEAKRLIRCRIQCLDPQKKDWPGEMISVGSAKLGTMKKFVPFNTGLPYHLPKMIFDMLDERQCSIFYQVKDKLGNPIKKAKQSKAFALEILPDLTKQELSELSRKQQMAQGVNA